MARRLTYRAVTAAELHEALRSLPRPPGAPLLSNHFGKLPSTPGLFPCARAGAAVAFAMREDPIDRVKVAGLAPRDIVVSMAALVTDRTQVLDVVMNHGSHSAELAALAVECGFREIAHLVRVSSTREWRGHGPSRTERRFAGIHQARAVHEALCRDFDVRVGHLPSLAECAELVANRQVLLAGATDTLSAYAIFRVDKGKFHFNYLRNATGAPDVLMYLLDAFHAEVRAQGLSRGYAWIDSTRPSLIAMHKRYGLEPDGAEALVLAREPAGHVRLQARDAVGSRESPWKK